MKFSIRLLYLYLFSFIGLLVSVIGSVRLVQLAIKVYVFKGADQYAAYVTPPVVAPEGKDIRPTQTEMETQRKINEAENTRQRQREVAEASAMLIIGMPLYLYHWKTIKREASKKKS